MFILIAIFILLFLVYGFLLDYYRRSWMSIPVINLEHTYNNETLPKISVIVPVRNEETNIPGLLESLLFQTYPKNLYEVIVVDDHSTDLTGQLTREFPKRDMKLGLLRLSDFTGAMTSRSYKKFAIETGISQASGDLIVTTDADCILPQNWLRAFASFYLLTNAKFIAAPVKINSSLSFLSVFQTLDFITLQGITGASVFKKFHSMCNGANLCYEKKAFQEVEGFKNIDNIPSGDDMLLMHKIYKRYPDQVFFLKSSDAIVSTRPESKWKDFIHQRVRWASKADKYDDKRIFWVLLLVYLFNLFFVVLLIASFWNSFFLYVLILSVLFKTIIEYSFVKSTAAFFGQENLMKYFPVMQPFHIVYTVIIGWLGKFGNYHWKGRKVN